MTPAQLLVSVKKACRIATDGLDTEIAELIKAAFYDLEISGVLDVAGQPYTAETADQLVITAVKTYVRLNLGDLLSDGESNRLSDSYWSQKAILKMRRHSSSIIPEEES